MDGATSIGLDVSIDASIRDPEDIDYYVFTVPPGGAIVDFEVFDASGVTCDTIDSIIALFAADQTTMIDLDDDGGINGCSYLSADLPAGTYYIGVAGHYPDSFDYVLDVSVYVPPPSVAETESNGTAGTADGPFTSDTLVTAAITPAYDEDVFAVRNPSGSAVSVRLETFTGSVGSCSSDTYLHVENASGTILASNDDGGVNACSLLTYSIPAATTVYVRIEPYSTGTTISSYMLEIDFP
jgi:hypothetical protein